MHFLNTIRSTFYDPGFYARVKDESLESAVKFFLKLGAAGIAIAAIVGIASIIPSTPSKFLDKLLAQYPDDLVIQVVNGELSINKPEPYYVPNTFDPSDLKNLVIFDTGDTLKADLKANSTLAMVKKTYVMMGSDTQQRVLPFSTSTATTTIAKKDVSAFIDNVRPYVMPAILIGGAFLALFFLVFGTIAWVLFHCMYVIVPSLAVFAIARSRGLTWNWHQSYMTALYATVPTAVVSLLLGLAHVRAPAYAYTIAVLIVAVVNTWNMMRPSQALESETDA